MLNYLNRYRAGEREQVWTELMQLGAAVREEPFYTEACMVAVTMMLRVRYNLAVLVQRLEHLNFQFAHGLHYAWCVPNKSDLILLEKIEARRGSLPIVTHVWGTHIGAVDFMGAHPRLSRYWSKHEPPDHGPSSDPLSFGVNPSNLSNVTRFNQKSPLYKLEIAPDISHKSNLSGGDSSYILIPNLAFDTSIVTGDWSDGLGLIPYIRTCFAWGGFPGLRDQPEAAAAAHEELAFLTKDLLAI